MVEGSLGCGARVLKGRIGMDVNFPELADLTAVPTGDMPGDKVQITPGHVAKAQVVFPELVRQLEPLLALSPHHRAVVAVCGGSGVSTP